MMVKVQSRSSPRLQRSKKLSESVGSKGRTQIPHHEVEKKYTLHLAAWNSLVTFLKARFEWNGVVGNRSLGLEEKMQIGKLETKEQAMFLSLDR